MRIIVGDCEIKDSFKQCFQYKFNEKQSKQKQITAALKNKLNSFSHYSLKKTVVLI